MSIDRPTFATGMGPLVSLCHLQPSDAPEMLEAIARSRELHAPWVCPPDSITELEDYIARAENYLRLGVRDVAGQLVAVINLNAIVRGAFQNAFLGFYVFAPYQGRGLMRAGLQAVIAEAFGPLNLHRLEANIQPTNERSAYLVRSLGFRHEGFSPRYLQIDGAWRDHDRYALTTEDVED